MEGHILAAEHHERCRQREQQERDRLVAETFILLGKVAESPYYDLALPKIAQYCRDIIDHKVN